MAEMTIISLGWGVQSWTLAAMSALGACPRWTSPCTLIQGTRERKHTFSPRNGGAGSRIVA